MYGGVFMDKINSDKDLNFEDLDELEKTILLMQKLNKGLDDIKNGRVTSLEEMKKKYGI